MSFISKMLLNIFTRDRSAVSTEIWGVKNGDVELPYFASQSVKISMADFYAKFQWSLGES